MKKKTQSRALPWFGADTAVAAQYATLLADRRHITVPFCGGLSVVAYLVETAGEIICNDLHELAMNFYCVLTDHSARESLCDVLRVTPFHASLLADCQDWCKEWTGCKDQHPDIDAAFRYFATCWMGRSGKAGTDSEFNGSLAMRWDAGGGSSPLRFQTAVRSLQEVWGPICERCSFVCLDWSDVLAKVKDSAACGVYLDPPWVGAGDDYKHKFEPRDHFHLCSVLSEFKMSKVVLRYGDDPLIRRLYALPHWHTREITSRDQANGGVQELCIANFEH